MSHLFLDIETYAAPHNESSALNPYCPESKVLVIAYSFYPGFKPPTKEEIKQPVFLKEWESSEKDILQRFYHFLREIHVDPYVKITGFNILKFDLPYLFGRMKQQGIASEEELFDILIRPFGVDLFQITPLISQKTIQHEQLWGINQKEANRFFNLQVKEGSGLDCSRYYDAGQYDLIMKYCTEEFNFEQLLDALYLRTREVVMRENQGRNN